MSSDKELEGFTFLEVETTASPSSKTFSDLSETYRQLDVLDSSIKQTNIQNPAMHNGSLTLKTSIGSNSKTSELGGESKKGREINDAKYRHENIFADTGCPKRQKTDSGESIHNLSNQAVDTQSQGNELKQGDLDRLIELQKRLLKIDQHKRKQLISLSNDVEDLDIRLNCSCHLIGEFKRRVLDEIEINTENICKLEIYLKPGNDLTAIQHDDTVSVPRLEGEETIDLRADLQLTSQAQFASNTTGSTNPAKEAEVECLDTLLTAQQQGYLQNADSSCFNNLSNPALDATTRLTQQHPGSTNPSGRVSDSTGPGTHVSDNTGPGTHVSDKTGPCNAGFGSNVFGNTGHGTNVPENTDFGSHVPGNAGFGSHVSGNAGFGSHVPGNAGFGSNVSGNQGLGTNVPGNAGFGSNVSGNTGLGTNVAGNAGFGSHVSGNASFGSNVSGNTGLGTNVPGNAGFGSNVSGNTGHGTNVSDNTGLGTNVAGNKGFGSHVPGNAGFGSNVSGKTGLGTNVPGNAGFGSNVSGNAGFGSNVSGNTGLGTNVHDNTGFGSHVPGNAGLGSHVSDNTGFGSNVTGNTGLGTNVPDNTGFCSHVSGNTGFGSNVSGNAGLGTNVPDNSGFGSHVPGNTGFGFNVSGNTGLGTNVPDNTGFCSHVSDNAGFGSHVPGNAGFGSNVSGNTGLGTNFPDNAGLGSHVSGNAGPADIIYQVVNTSSGLSSRQPTNGKMQQQGTVYVYGGDPLQASGRGPLPPVNGVGVDQAQGLSRAGSAHSSQKTRDVGFPSHQVKVGGLTSAAPTCREDRTSTGPNHQGPAGGTPFLQESNQSPNASTGQKNVTLLLVGSSGNGKSATGNSILSKQVFKRSASSSVQSATDASNIRMESTVIAGQSVNVIDGPGINDCGNLQSQDLEKIIGAMLKSLKLCNFEFHALLIALKFGVRFTKQEVETIKLIRCLLGKDVIRDYGVCVITHGDNFEAAVEEAKDFNETLTFDKWIQTQTGEVKHLLEECQKRYVLFDNATKDDGIRQKQIIELMAVLPKGKQYSLEEFGRAGEDQAKLRLQASLPELISQLTAKAADIRSSMNAVLERDHVTDIVTFVSRMAALLAEVCVLQAEVEKKHAGELNHVAIEIKLLKNDISTKITHSLKSEELKVLERKQRSSNNTGSSSYQNKPDDYTFAVKLPSTFSDEFLLHCENAINYSEKITDSNTRSVFLCIIKATLRKFVENFRSHLDESRLKQAKELHQEVREKLRYKDTGITAQQVVSSEKHRPREIAFTKPSGDTDDRDRSYDTPSKSPFAGASANDRSYDTPSKSPFAGASAKDRSYDDSSDKTYSVNSSSWHMQQSWPSQQTDESLALPSYPYHENHQVLATSSFIETIIDIVARRVEAWRNQLR